MTHATLTVFELQNRLLELVTHAGVAVGMLSVRLIVGGVAYPVTDVWLEPRQENGSPAVCIGDDPR